MANGFMYKSVCFAFQQDATDFYYQSQPVNISTIYSSNGLIVSTVYTSYVRLPTGLWNTLKQSLSPTGVVSTLYNVTAGVQNFGTCSQPISTISTGGVVVVGGVNGNVDTGAYDYLSATSYWSFAFIAILMHWFLAKKIGLVLSAIRRF